MLTAIQQVEVVK